MDDFCRRSGQRDNLLRKLQNGEFHRISKIHRSGDFIRRLHQTQKPLDKIVDIAKRPGLIAGAIDCNVLIAKRLNDEIRHDASVVGVHPRAIGVENPCDLDR